MKMNSNESAIAHLSGLIAGDRIERGYTRFCSLCMEQVMTAENQIKINDIKARAASIVVRLNEPDADPGLWAVLLKDSPFDNFDAKVCRGEAVRSDGTEAAASAMLKAFSEMMHSGSGTLGFPEPANASERAKEADKSSKQRHIAYWEDFKNRSSLLFRFEGPRHLDDCPNRAEPVAA
jgi:hypothetical protein